MIKSGENEMGGTCSTHGGDKKSYNIMVSNNEGKRPLGRRISRWEHNIKMDFKEIGWEGVEWIHLAQYMTR
jgi:hypothetical protein